MTPDGAGSSVCGACGEVVEAPSGPGPDGAGAPCPRCGSTVRGSVAPDAAPFPGQPTPERLHLQFLTPRPPPVPGDLVHLGPYLPLGRHGSTPRQWAADPSGRNQWRWWSGRVWTDHVANDGVASVDPIE